MALSPLKNASESNSSASQYADREVLRDSLRSWLKQASYKSPLFKLAQTEIEWLINALPENGAPVALRHYKADQIVVHKGTIEDAVLVDTPEFHYCHVPFGIIIEGSMTVTQNNVGVRRLSAGDCLGVFETAHWLNTASSRRVGDWTLTADRSLTILFFGSSLLEPTKRGPIMKFREFIIELARHDHVPLPVTDLPLLDWVAARTTTALMDRTAIIIHSHLLPTNVALIRHIAHLLGPSNVYILDKPYSTQRRSLYQLVRAGIDVTQVIAVRGESYANAQARSLGVLWQKISEAFNSKSFNKLLVLDDGGDLWVTVPWARLRGLSIAGVEQTQRGVTRFRNSNFPIPPVVAVASSGIKKIVEPEFIISASMRKLQEGGFLRGTHRVGIIGMGSLGQAMYSALKRLGKDVIGYDIVKPESLPREDYRRSIDVLIQDCDLILGTTGTDCLRGVALDFDKVFGLKIFASLSSADIEFNMLLKLVRDWHDPYGHLLVAPHVGLQCMILNGGYPINFDREDESEPPEDIALTRCLLYVGLMQAAMLLGQEPSAQNFYALDNTAQRKILGEWLRRKDECDEPVKTSLRNIASVVDGAGLEVMKETPSIWQDRAV